MTEAEQILTEVRAMNARLGQEHAENRTDAADFKREVREKLDELTRAFPGDDPEGHRQFHDALVAEALERKKFYRELRGKLLEKGIWALAVFVAGAVWFYVKEGR